MNCTICGKPIKSVDAATSMSTSADVAHISCICSAYDAAVIRAEKAEAEVEAYRKWLNNANEKADMFRGDYEDSEQDLEREKAENKRLRQTLDMGRILSCENNWHSLERLFSQALKEES